MGGGKRQVPEEWLLVETNGKRQVPEEGLLVETNFWFSLSQSVEYQESSVSTTLVVLERDDAQF